MCTDKFLILNKIVSESSFVLMWKQIGSDSFRIDIANKLISYISFITIWMSSNKGLMLN